MPRLAVWPAINRRARKRVARCRDRLIAMRFGAAAVRCVERGEFGTMVALDPPNVLAVPLESAISRIKRVPLESDLVQTARDVGISFGD